MSEEKVRDSFIATFDKAQKDMAACSKEFGRPALPSLNEIRYAVRHILDAKKKEANDESGEKDWQRAERHVSRACSDVKEFEIALLMNRIVNYNRLYEGHEYMMARCVIGYHEHLRNYNAYCRHLAEFHDFDRDDPKYADLCADYKKKLVEFCKAFETGESKRRAAIRKETRRKRLHLLCGFVSVMMGTIGGFVLGSMVDWDTAFHKLHAAITEDLSSLS